MSGYIVLYSDAEDSIMNSRGVQLCLGSLWLPLIVIFITMVLDFKLFGAGRALGRGTRAGSEHERREKREREGMKRIQADGPIGGKSVSRFN
jgi:hypothetical protein